ncbi:N-acetyltransferase 8-like [Oculina patagonica]
MKLQSAHYNSTQSEVKQLRNTDVIIRSFQSRDSHVVRKIFAESMGEMRGPLVRDVMCQGVLYGLCLSLPAAVLNFVWFSWFLTLYFFVCFALLLALFAGLQTGFSRYIQKCLHTDLDNVESIYLCQKRSHMWVAELNGNIIGMVALVPDHEDSFGKPREAVGRLRRMAVLPEFRRLGVAKKLLRELLNYSREIGYKEIVLLTTSAQEAALRFYPKHGFQLVSKRLANIALRGFYHYVYCYDLERLNKVI